jgi:CheY-like chemotaxis protein
MASRTLLCVEPDERAVAQIRNLLAPYGIAVESIPNGEAAVDWARANEPVMIVVSVEPRKVGYAVCNKLKRSAELQHIPLILTSAEETPQTFEQHKKLKSRADDYLLKPFGDEDFVGKVGGLIDLGPPMGHSGNGTGAKPNHSLMGADVSEELAVGDSDIVEEDVTGNLRAPRAASPFGGQRGGLDPAFEQETDAAFAALQSTESTPPAAERESAASMWEEEKTRSSVLESELPDVDVDETGTPFADLFQSDQGGEATPFPPNPDDVKVTPDPAVEGRIGELSARVQALQNERQVLTEQVQHLRRQIESGGALPVQPMSKDREYLSLRETINRKEKDLLDLRDALDAKDRQILDQKDRFRELDRARRDLDEKMLDLERNLVAAEERAAALSHDKEKAVERERALKSRQDDLLIELHKAREENEDLEKRVAHTEEARQDLDHARDTLDKRLAETEERHRAELARLREERTQSENGLRAEIDELKKRSAEELNVLSEQLLGELERTRNESEKKLSALKAEQTEALERERKSLAESLQSKDSAHASELEAARQRLEDERAEADQRRQRELGEAETRRLVDLEAAEHRRLGELKELKDDYENKLSAVERLHLNEKGELGDRHREEVDQATSRANRAEAELETRNGELADLRTRLQSLQTDHDRLAGDLADRETKLGQLREKASDLEAKAAEYEDQILRAYQKLRSDDKLIERAKRALAVSLQVLDERTAGPPGASTPAPSIASGLAPAQPAGEDPAAGG